MPTEYVPNTMNSPTVIASAPQLVVPDVQKTAAWYCDVLGCSLIALVGNPPVYAMVQRDGFQLHFAKSDRADIPRNHEYRSISHDFILWVPEIDAFVAELRSRGARIVEDITLRSYGSRECVVEDCDGHRILIGD